MNELVVFDHVSQSYGARPVLQDVSFGVEPGRIVGLLGPNGTGKTTIIKIMAGLILDYQGRVSIDGHSPGAYTKGIVSYLPEKTYLHSWMKAGDAIAMFADFYADFDRRKSDEMMRRFSLDPAIPVKNMSKGMQEKLQLVLVMSRNAKLYLLDEPLGGVDPASRSMILDTILQNYSEDASLLLSTHLIYDVERIFDSIVMLGYEGIIMNDTVDNLREKSGKSIDDIFREVFRC
jgi:ABC-2 type transport system ATP-binding protein